MVDLVPLDNATGKDVEMNDAQAATIDRDDGMTSTQIDANSAILRCDDVRFVKELYPRLKPIDDVIERYRDSLENLPAIVIARDGVLVDGYHRWQAHVREKVDVIRVENLGNLTDAEIIRESIQRNARHGQQLSRQDKQRLAGQLWQSMAHLANGERVADLQELLGVSRDSIERWTKDARQAEKRAQQDRAWDLWLDCLTQEAIAEAIGAEQRTVSNWLEEIRKCGDFLEPPDSRQHFDIWQFQSADKDAGSQSYFGALPPQVVENLLWFSFLLVKKRHGRPFDYFFPSIKRSEAK